MNTDEHEFDFLVEQTTYPFFWVLNKFFRDAPPSSKCKPTLVFETEVTNSNFTAEFEVEAKLQSNTQCTETCMDSDTQRND